MNIDPAVTRLAEKNMRAANLIGQPPATSPTRPKCPACGQPLDGGPIAFWCRCGMSVQAGSLDHETRAPLRGAS